GLRRGPGLVAGEERAAVLGRVPPGHGGALFDERLDVSCRRDESVAWRGARGRWVRAAGRRPGRRSHRREPGRSECGSIRECAAAHARLSAVFSCALKNPPSMKSVTLAAALLVLTPLAARAQSPTGSIDGLIVDQSRSVLSGVAVTLRHEATGIERAIHT